MHHWNSKIDCTTQNKKTKLLGIILLVSPNITRTLLVSGLQQDVNFQQLAMTFHQPLILSITGPNTWEKQAHKFWFSFFEFHVTFFNRHCLLCTALKTNPVCVRKPALFRIYNFLLVSNANLLPITFRFDHSIYTKSHNMWQQVAKTSLKKSLRAVLSSDHYPTMCAFPSLLICLDFLTKHCIFNTVMCHELSR